MTAGRPRKYETPEEMQSAIDAYFEECQESGDIPLQSGLALFLGFSNRQSLYDYDKKEEFSCILERARLKCEHSLNNAALKNEVNATMAKLNLASSYGYSDKQQIEHSGDGLPVKITIEGVKPESTDS